MKQTLLQKFAIFSILAMCIYSLVDDTSAISYNWTSTLWIPSSFTYSWWTLKISQYPYTGYPRSCMYTSGGWSWTTDWTWANSNQAMPTFCEQIWTQHWSYFLTYSEFDRNANSGNSIIVDHRWYYTQNFWNAIWVTVNLEYTSTGINIVNKVNDNSWLWDVEPIFFIPSATTSSGFYPDRFWISHISAFMTEFGAEDSNVTWSNVYSVFTLTCLYNSWTTSQCKMTDYTGSWYANNWLWYLLNTQYILGLANEFYPTSVMTQHKNYVAEDLSFSWNFDTATKFMIDWWKTNTFPNWLWTTNWYTTTPPENTWGTNTGTIDYFADCKSFINVWCYIKWAWNNFTWYVWTFFVDISFTWNFDSCATASTESWTTMQKFWNAIAIINPYPVNDWETVCTVWWEKEIHYSYFVPTENFFQKYIPWQMPELEISMFIIWQQTLWDLITILVFILLIFYSRKHD